ncbi:hypothetical protein EDD21DRAFT_137055 [Dissophora ornata]|nr:hypothetical protein BGZ58_006604 [Dissophora ornata]KAI8600324.1 hypothetical protein EDD21DRAFT_137055 [Dissophora ornata]
MEYFVGFPNFTVRQGEHLRNAFNRLAKEKHWEKAKKVDESRNFQRLVVQDLNSRFNKLEHYQDLCEKLFETTPNTLTQCKLLLNTKYVNIWDIVEERYQYFDNFREFRKYTCPKRIFKKDIAKELLLNVFLRHL